MRRHSGSGWCSAGGTGAEGDAGELDGMWAVEAWAGTGLRWLGEALRAMAQGAE